MKADDVKQIAVVGAGLMGHGIAQEFALAGYAVHMHARTEASLGTARAHIERNLDYLVGLGRLSRAQADAEVANPMSRYPRYKARRDSWRGSFDPVGVLVTADDGSWGFGTTILGPATTSLINDHLGPLLVEENPLATDRLWDMMMRISSPYSPAGLASYAISGIDLALWDLKGRVLKGRALAGPGAAGAVATGSGAMGQVRARRATSLGETPNWRLKAVAKLAGLR